MRLAPASLLAFSLVCGCVQTPPLATVSAAPKFDAIAFFSGETLGTGSLEKVFSGTERTIVHGNGRVEGNTLILDQTVEEGDKPAKTRTWRIHRDGPDRLSGTLNDATGLVTGVVEGNRLHLAFTMKGGLPTDQWLTLARDGRSAHNVMIVKKFGLRVAVLDETIRKTD